MLLVKCSQKNELIAFSELGQQSKGLEDGQERNMDSRGCFKKEIKEIAFQRNSFEYLPGFSKTQNECIVNALIWLNSMFLHFSYQFLCILNITSFAVNQN